jgi:hypothetical protein
MTHAKKGWIARGLAGGLALFIVCNSALAITDLSRTLDRLGTQGGDGGGNAYFSVVEPLSLNCLFNDIYVDNIGTDFGRAAYALLLEAKATGKMLSRIDYTQSGGPGTTCTVSLVELEN